MTEIELKIHNDDININLTAKENNIDLMIDILTKIKTNSDTEKVSDSFSIHPLTEPIVINKSITVEDLQDRKHTIPYNTNTFLEWMKSLSNPYVAFHISAFKNKHPKISDKQVDKILSYLISENMIIQVGKKSFKRTQNGIRASD